VDYRSPARAEPQFHTNFQYTPSWFQTPKITIDNLKLGSVNDPVTGTAAAGQRINAREESVYVSISPRWLWTRLIQPDDAFQVGSVCAARDPVV